MNKYRNIRTRVDGKNFASRREASRYTELRLLERAGRIEGLMTQVRLPLKVNGETVSHYVADFTYREDGQLVIEDTKGFQTDVFKLKRKLVRVLYGVDIRLT